MRRVSEADRLTQADHAIARDQNHGSEIQPAFDVVLYHCFDVTESW